MSLATALGRASRLRCPHCGGGKLFRTWFSMFETCSRCGASFVREDGFFLGSIYFNYGLTALIVAVAYPILLFSGVVRNQNLLTGAALAFVVLLPLWFFRYARSLWLGLTQHLDPTAHNAVRAERAPAGRKSSDPPPQGDDERPKAEN